jgi:hypothetical protein
MTAAASHVVGAQPDFRFLEIKTACGQFESFFDDTHFVRSPTSRKFARLLHVQQVRYRHSSQHEKRDTGQANVIVHLFDLA